MCKQEQAPCGNPAQEACTLGTQYKEAGAVQPGQLDACRSHLAQERKRLCTG